jgi:hypothetical protein
MPPSDKSTNDNNDNINTASRSRHLIHEAFAFLVTEHASLTHTHNTLREDFFALERELRWYSTMHNSAHAEIQDLQAACHALEAERDAIGEKARLGLKAKRGPLGGRLVGREKMGEVWRLQVEFVWVKVEEMGWVVWAKRGLEGVKGIGRKVREGLGEVREECKERMKGIRRRSVVPRVVREDLSF